MTTVEIEAGDELIVIRVPGDGPVAVRSSHSRDQAGEVPRCVEVLRCHAAGDPQDGGTGCWVITDDGTRKVAAPSMN